MKKLYAASDLVDANLLLASLRERGISAHVRGEHLWQMRGAIPFTDALPTVWIDHDDEEPLAREVLAAHALRPPPGPDWGCPSCGEEVDGHFEACWKCGAERPDLHVN
jgi:Putative prokaryotic signal transducing protein